MRSRKSVKQKEADTGASSGSPQRRVPLREAGRRSKLFWLKGVVGVIIVIAWCGFILARFDEKFEAASSYRQPSEMDLSLPMYLFGSNQKQTENLAMELIGKLVDAKIRVRVQRPKFGGSLLRWLVVEGQAVDERLMVDGAPSFGGVEDADMIASYVDMLQPGSQSIGQLWESSRLLLTQTCGYPLTHGYEDKLQVVGTPVYSCDGCSGASYSSVLLVPAASTIQSLADAQGGTMAANSPGSQSGFHAMKAAVGELMARKEGLEGPFFSEVRMTGAHAESMAMVKRGEADICAIDSVSYATLSKFSPEEVSGLRPVGFTPLALGLPLVTSVRTTPTALVRMQEVLEEVLTGSALAEDVLITGFERTTLLDYQKSILGMEQKWLDVDLGYRPALK